MKNYELTDEELQMMENYFDYLADLYETGDLPF